MVFFDILTILGGLCLFLFGMNVMSDSLERRAGNSLRTILGKLTTGKAGNPDYKIRYQDYSKKYALQ